METLSRLIASINPYARAFKMMQEVEIAEEELAHREQRTPPRLKMVYQESRERGLTRRPYDLPTANEVAVVYTAEDDSVPASQSLAVHQRRGTMQQIVDINRKCDTLTYPLFFPTGEDSWHADFKNSENKRIT